MNLLQKSHDASCSHIVINTALVVVPTRRPARGAVIALFAVAVRGRVAAVTAVVQLVPPACQECSMSVVQMSHLCNVTRVFTHGFSYMRRQQVLRAAGSNVPIPDSSLDGNGGPPRAREAAVLAEGAVAGLDGRGRTRLARLAALWVRRDGTGVNR